MAERSLQDIVKQHYRTGKETEQRSQFKTTSDIFAIIDEHAPGRFDIKELYDVLIAIGFEEKLMDAGIHWVLVPR